MLERYCPRIVEEHEVSSVPERFVPQYLLIGTIWQVSQDPFVSWGESSQPFNSWKFRDDSLCMPLDDGDDGRRIVVEEPFEERAEIGRWDIDENGRLQIRITVGEGASYETLYDDRRFQCGDEFVLRRIDAPGTRRLRYSGCAAMDGEGRNSYEWMYYWNSLVPEEGQADTQQGELLREVERLGVLPDRVGYSYDDHTDTYEAYFENCLAAFGDGTLESSIAQSAVAHVERLLAYCRRELEGDAPAVKAMYDEHRQLPVFAVEWIRANPTLIPRNHDPRMRF